MKHVRPLFLALLPLLLALAMFFATTVVGASTLGNGTDTVVGEPTIQKGPVISRAVERSAKATDRLHRRAWFLACAWSRYSCAVATRPHVIYRPMFPGDLGRYWRGEDEVWINELLQNEPMEVIVLVHEFTHYLQYHSGAWEAPFTKAKVCKLEEEAFDVSSRVADAIYDTDDYRMRGWDAARAETYGCPIEE